MNTNFGKLENGNITYAPDSIVTHERTIFYPTAEQYLAQGWKAVNATAPTDAPEGKHYEPNGWEETETAITRLWTLVDDPAPVTTYAVEEIIYGLITHNALAAVKEIVGDYWELLTMRDTIATDNEIYTAVWPELKAAIIASGALTETELAAVLKDAEV